jgi:hypothetical protein
MNQISGSIVFLAAAVLWAPGVSNPRLWENALPYAAPIALLGIVMIIDGLRKGS